MIRLSSYRAGRCRSGFSSGSSLIVVLWIIGLLSMFVMAFAFDMHIQAKITSTWRKKLKAEYLARGGIELARMTLLETGDPDVNNTDSSVYLSKGSEEELRMAAYTLAHGGGASFSRELGEGSVSVTISPENARMNINSMINVTNREETYQNWDSLFETVGVPRETRDELVDCLIDWVDVNELSHLNGVESEYYERLTPPYSSKNGPFDTVNELVLIKGFDELIHEKDKTVYQAVSKFLTTYSEGKKININAALRDTLMAYLEIDAQLADEIIAARAGSDGIEGTDDDRPFKDANDFLTRMPAFDPSVADHIAFSATGRFTITSRGKAGNIERLVSCVAKLEDRNLTVLNWIEGDLEQDDLIIH